MSYRSFGAFITSRKPYLKGYSLEDVGQRIFSAAHRFDAGESFDLVLSWSPYYADFYVNGKHEGRVKLNDVTPDVTPEYFSVGAPQSRNDSTETVVEKLRIYNKPLTEKQVKDLSINEYRTSQN
jgi:hypothetical protein